MNTSFLNLKNQNRVLLMGILNITPDSFSDGGEFLHVENAIRRAEEMVEEGADILDIGGESSRPGSEEVSEEEECRRILPIVERIASEIKVPISIDTTKSGVARRGLECGAGMINDISAFRFDPEMASVVSRAGASVVLMHMQGRPRDMQADPVYGNVVGEVADFLSERAAFAEGKGIPGEKIILDPGIGFGKTLAHNLEIMANLEVFCKLGYPVMVGPSRKSFIGKILDLPVRERLEGTAAAVAVSVLGGASLIRVHDVRSMRRVIRVSEEIRKYRDH